MSDQTNSNIFFSDKSFSEDSTSSYSLSLLTDTTCVAFTIFHPYSNTYIGFGCYKTDNKSGMVDTIEKIVIDNPWLKSGFESVNLIISNPTNSFVPDVLFDESKKETYLKFIHSIPKDSRVLSDQLKHMSAANVYYGSEQLIKYISSVWPSAKIIHSSTVLIESLLINFKNILSEKTVYTNVKANYFEVVNFKHGKLNFYNTFRYKTKEDFIYFLLATLEQLNLNPENTDLVFLGDLDKQDPLFEISYKYIRNCSLIGKNKAFNYSYIFDEVNYLKYYILLNILQCV